MKLTNCRLIGRYLNPETNRPVNVHKGRWMTRGVDILYYLYRGKRVCISSGDFYNKWEKVND